MMGESESSMKNKNPEPPDPNPVLKISESMHKSNGIQKTFASIVAAGKNRDSIDLQRRASGVLQRRGNKDMKNNSESDALSAVSMEVDKFPVNQMSSRSDNLSGKSVSCSINAFEASSNSNNCYSNRRFLIEPDDGRLVAPNKYRNYSQVTMDKCTVESNDDMKTNRSELGNARLRAQIGADRYQRSQHSSDWPIGERGNDVVTFLDSNYPYEGPSINYSGSSYGRYEKVLNSPNESSDEYKRVEYLEEDRAQILRKLEELNNQLNRSCNVVGKPKHKTALDGMMATQDPYVRTRARFPGASTSSTTSSMRSFIHDNHVSKPPYNHHYHDPDPSVNMHERGMHGLYQPPNYGDPSQYQQQPSHPYFSRQYIDTHSTPLELHIPNHISHNPSCSCTYCYDNDWQVPPPMPTSTFGNNPTFYSCKRASQLSTPDTLSPKRWLNDAKSDMGGGGSKSHPQREAMANNGRSCRPVGGGSPFIICCNCFELLQLPQRVRTEKNEQKIKCGMCLVVLSCAILDKKPVISVYVETKQTVTRVNDNSGEVVKPSNDHTNQDSDTFLSDDFDSSGYDIQPLVIAHNESLSDRDFNSSKAEGKQGIHSTANSSEDEASQVGLITRKELVKSTDLQNKFTLFPLPPGSSLQDYFDYSSINHRNRSSPLVQEKVMKSPSVATEMEVSFNEYSHTRSVDSGDTVSEEVRPKFNHSKDLVKKNIASNDIVEEGKSIVKINGRSLPNHLVKKAERLAGPIRPGQYWYDYRAGFWGVTGGPCLGIIPPYIEEFNYPMREDCAGGDTSVFVNGRELHQRDLKLLMSRGLPPGRNRSYVIDITGKVLDEETGDELNGLGKLAPTVEKAKHGFGMKVPGAAAS